MFNWKERIRKEDKRRIDDIEARKQEEQEKIRKGFEYDSRFWTDINPKALLEDINRDV